nr:hypothetical protein [uncultured Draconibacterium sp.]
MKIKYIIFCLIALFVVNSTKAQKDENRKGKKIKLKKYELVPDSIVASWNLIVSSPSFSKSKKQAYFTEAINRAQSVRFSLDEEKGIIYVDFVNMPKHVRPNLSISNENSDVIYKTQVKFANNVVNMTKLPPGTYLFSADVDEEISTWEFVKE